MLYVSVTVTVGLVACTLAASVQGNDNGVGRSPPMGWRNWNYFRGKISQSIMEMQMNAMVNRSRPVILPNGSTPIMSLRDIGYIHAGLDDNWQHCHAGVHGPGPYPGGFHNASGWPLVNTTTFPDMKAMVDHGHILGLKVGWYDNNCICGEGSSRLTEEQVQRDVAGNVAFIDWAGFDGLKADGCGAGRNMTRLAQLLNETGRPVLIENCHYNKVEPGQPMPSGAFPDPKGRIFPYWKDNITGGELICPENTFRASYDIRNSWSSWFSNLGTLTRYQDPVYPISQPGCWAYADMLMVGVGATTFEPDDGPPASVTEWRSHFGAWAVVSSPLILSFDMANTTTMDSVWPIITNVEAIAVNQIWAGHPGRQVAANQTLQVWAKNLSASAQAVYVVNMSPSPINYIVDVTEFGLPKTTTVVRNIWTHKTESAVAGLYAINRLQSHDSAFIVLGGLTIEY